MAEVEFRDGPREVPDYLVALMADLPTYKMTFKEAVAATNYSLVRWRVSSFRDDLIVQHMRKLRGR